MSLVQEYIDLQSSSQIPLSFSLVTELFCDSSLSPVPIAATVVFVRLNSIGFHLPMRLKRTLISQELLTENSLRLT